MHEIHEPHILERGKDYYEFNHVHELEICGDMIYASVRGSAGEYNTSVNLATSVRSKAGTRRDGHCRSHPLFRGTCLQCYHGGRAIWLKPAEAWKRYITELQREYKRLPALQDELRTAGLV
jgi:hypothetical protein